MAISSSLNLFEIVNYISLHF